MQGVLKMKKKKRGRATKDNARCPRRFKTSNKMTKVNLTHVVEADADITGVSIDENGNVTVNYQVFDVDQTKKTKVAAGDPVTLTLDADKSAAVIAAILPVVSQDIIDNEDGEDTS